MNLGSVMQAATDRSLRTAIALLALCLDVSSVAAAPEAVSGAAPRAFTVPDWLFPINPPATAPTSAVPDAQPLHLPGSAVAFTRSQVTNMFFAPDWYPSEHSPMPEVVMFGREPAVYACGYCHLPDGRGRPENATVAGLPAEYIVRQVRDFATHARHAAWEAPAFRPSSSMTRVAESVADEDVAAAAVYFAAQQLREPRARLIETERVPKTRVAGWLYVPMDGTDDEPLGSRIVELVRDFERHELRDSRAEYVAYVPVGSIERGGQLATAGAGDRTIPCITCHGPGLRGGGVAPPIAGRSPTYVLRQLVAFRTGARATPAGRPMQEVVAHLDLDEMIALAAYVAASPP